MSLVLFRNARIFDGWDENCPEGMDVLVEDDVIKEISAKPIKAGEADVIDVAGRTLMPGMIDAHVHVHVATRNIDRLKRSYPTYYAHYAGVFLRHSLNCGFTTVRDTGAGDVGLARALQDGFLFGPRLFYGGKVLTQTGGHADTRAPDEVVQPAFCGCFMSNDFIANVTDGADAVRAAAREELRRGAHHVKMMGTGNFADPHHGMDMVFFTDDEVRAAVEEAERMGKYVCVHCFSDTGIRRFVNLGVRCIEHGNLIEEDTAKLVAEKGAFIVPTLATIDGVLRTDGEHMPANLREETEYVLSRSLDALEMMKRVGVKVGFGTDLIGENYIYQSNEFALRRPALEPIDILRSACRVNAEIVCMEGKIGTVAEGAYADLLIVDGDPLGNIELMADDGKNLSVIMKGGVFHKRTL